MTSLQILAYLCHGLRRIHQPPGPHTLRLFTQSFFFLFIIRKGKHRLGDLLRKQLRKRGRIRGSVYREQTGQTFFRLLGCLLLFRKCGKCLLRAGKRRLVCVVGAPRFAKPCLILLHGKAKLFRLLAFRLQAFPCLLRFIFLRHEHQIVHAHANLGELLRQLLLRLHRRLSSALGSRKRHTRLGGKLFAVALLLLRTGQFLAERLFPRLDLGKLRIDQAL